jgi:hypothetical protein
LAEVAVPIATAIVRTRCIVAEDAAIVARPAEITLASTVVAPSVTVAITGAVVKSRVHAAIVAGPAPIALTRIIVAPSVAVTVVRACSIVETAVISVPGVEALTITVQAVAVVAIAIIWAGSVGACSVD